MIFEKGTPGFEVLRLEDKMSHPRLVHHRHRLAQRLSAVPRKNLLSEPGDGLKILLASLNKSRPSIAAHALGIA